jgi:hypothetical protein
MRPCCSSCDVKCATEKLPGGGRRRAAAPRRPCGVAITKWPHHNEIFIHECSVAITNFLKSVDSESYISWAGLLQPLAATSASRPSVAK